MQETLTQLGVGGIFVILVLREVFNFLKNHKNNKTKQCGEISRVEFEKHKDVVQYKRECGEIVKRLEERFDSVDAQFDQVKAMIGDLKL